MVMVLREPLLEYEWNTFKYSNQQQISSCLFKLGINLLLN